MVDVSQIKLQISLLEAQKAGIEEQVKHLREIPCPANCNNGYIRKEEPDPNVTGAVLYTDVLCEVCNGTGFALGERPSYRY